MRRRLWVGRGVSLRWTREDLSEGGRSWSRRQTRTWLPNCEEEDQSPTDREKRRWGEGWGEEAEEKEKEKGKEEGEEEERK